MANFKNGIRPKKNKRPQVSASERFVKERFPRSRVVRHPTIIRYRVMMQWRKDPNLAWRDTKEDAWKAAERFLRTGKEN